MTKIEKDYGWGICVYSREHGGNYCREYEWFDSFEAFGQKLRDTPIYNYEEACVHSFYYGKFHSGIIFNPSQYIGEDYDDFLGVAVYDHSPADITFAPFVLEAINLMKSQGIRWSDDQFENLDLINDKLENTFGEVPDECAPLDVINLLKEFDSNMNQIIP